MNLFKALLLSLAIFSSANAATNVENFKFGTEYMPLQQGIAEVYANTGVENVASAGIDWEVVEPYPPFWGRHFYNWDIDDLIIGWQQLGVKPQLWLKSKSSWATKPVQGGINASTPPYDNRWYDYALFVYNVIERYDMDGYKDAPGLLYPVEYILIENEAQGPWQWQGSVEEYITLLDVANQARDAANPNTKIILSSFTFHELLDTPGDITLFNSMIGPGGLYEYQFNFNKKLLARSDLYDYISFNYLTNNKSVINIVDWIRDNGGTKPIWARDAFGGLLLYYNELTAKYTPEDRDYILNALRYNSDPDVVTWFRNQQVAEMIKKTVLAMEQGLYGMNIGNTKDWNHLWNGNLYQQSTAPLGMVNADLSPRSAYFTLEYLANLVDSTTTIERLTSVDDTYVFELVQEDNSLVYIGWYDDGIYQTPWESEGSIDVTITLDGLPVDITLTEMPMELN